MDNTIQELNKQIAFLEMENKELGKSLKMLQTAPEHVKDGDLKAAIEEFSKSVNFRMNSDVNRQKAAKMVHWLGKLAAYQDKSYITAEWLRNNGFEPLKAGGYLLDAEVAEIEATLKDCEAGIWKVEVQYYESHTADTAYICTVGQMRLFLAAAGFEDILKV